MDASVVARAAERAPSPTTTGGEGHASAKAILLGEHAVVYGEPALAVPLSALGVRARVEFVDAPSRLRSALYTGPLDRAPARTAPTVAAVEASLAAFGAASRTVAVQIASDVPTERGLGSSAAVAAAIVDAVADALGVDPDDDQRHELVQMSERAAHGTPSGLDARAVRSPSALWFRSGNAEHVEIAAPLHLVIADTGIRGRTRQAVADVRARREAAPAETDELIRSLGALVALGRDQLRTGDLDGLGSGMDAAHTALTALGVGHAALDRLALTARRQGALGAKLTGGGQGGCLLALAPDLDSAERISQALREAGAPATWTTTVEVSA